MDLLVGLLLEAGVFNSSFRENTSDEVTYRFRAGYENMYLWYGKEKPDVNVLGQFMGNTTIDGFGVGTRYDIGKLAVFIEGGYGFVSLDAQKSQQYEVNYTYLVGRHAVGNRRIPLDCASSGCYGGDFGTDYSIDDAVMGRVGIEYQAFKHGKLSASYRWMHADEYIAIYDFDRREANAGWWEETNTRNFSAFEIGILINW